MPTAGIVGDSCRIGHRGLSSIRGRNATSVNISDRTPVVKRGQPSHFVEVGATSWPRVCWDRWTPGVLAIGDGLSVRGHGVGFPSSARYGYRIALLFSLCRRVPPLRGGRRGGSANPANATVERGPPSSRPKGPLPAVVRAASLTGRPRARPRPMPRSASKPPVGMVPATHRPIIHPRKSRQPRSLPPSS